ncbi:IclR family transcriptional regulator C-terminal domain-containing protein [Tersicoccus sp. Bi-70]|uniref:IclR family transcriptional regulator domain-containing protein n=1 Tax=Tersicoccus sp. Bi-70 TaxID=1897634 RepID=UPI00097714EF|nr:IclR family transcriptional regulator C-terminal domain-containing protein [Tersicoccus sp. Bi-70]OMH36669.1 IclR family transcriptional regulator [Tersicoccus sp. Bi-70]
MSRENPDVIDSVEKAFRLLQVFSHEHPSLTISEAAELSALTRPTARRILLTMVDLGFADADGNRFTLTPKVMRLGFAYLSALPYWETAQPHMRKLASELNESCSMATLDGNEIVYLTRVPGNRSMVTTLNTGSRLPAYATSLGKVLLAHLAPAELDRYLSEVELVPLTPSTVTDPDTLRRVLAEVREQGYATADGEREEGIRSASAPVLARGGHVVAAINVSANAARVSHEKLVSAYVPALVETARTISEEIGAVTVMH